MIEMLPQHIVNGVTTGGVYALIALGLALIFGLMHVLNIAHGEVITLGGFASYYVAELVGLNWALGLLFAIVVGGTFGLFAERLLFRRVAGDRFRGLIVAFGLALIIQGVGFYFWKGSPRYTAPPLTGVFQGGLVSVSHQRLLVLGLSLLLFALLYYFLRHTRMGKSIRAMAQNPTAAALMGISVRRVYSTTFVLASLLGSAGGALLASLMTIGPFFGASVVMKGFVIVVLGGMGYVPGALAGGLILGLVESIGVGYFYSAFRDGYSFILLILVLLLRPKGLFGAKEIL